MGEYCGFWLTFQGFFPLRKRILPVKEPPPGHENIRPQPMEGPGHGVMLKAGDHHSVPRLDQGMNGHVQSVGGVQGEHHLLRPAIKQRRRPLPAGEIGEICIKGVPGKTIFKEYFLNPKATAKVLEADGWLHTGDTGYRDEEGFFYFVDRRCNMIKRGGENVSCVELENIIATHPKIQDIVVVGIKDSIRDEAIKAFVVLNEGETLSEEEFFRFCEQNMAKFKVPSYLEIRKDLPRNCSGKIIRKNLK